MKSFEEFLGRDIAMARLVGIFYIDATFTGKSKEITIWQSLYYKIAMGNLAMVNFLGLFNALDCWADNFEYFIEVVASLFAGVLCFCKAYRLWFWREELVKLLHRFSIMWKDVDYRKTIREENLKTAEKTYQLAKLYLTIVMIIGCLYSIRPYTILLIHRLSSKYRNESYGYEVTVLPVKYPFAINTLSRFVMTVTWGQISIFYVGFCWTAGDNIFAQLTTHASIHFRILRHYLEQIGSSSDEYDERNEETLVQRLSMIATRHRDLFNYCDLIQQIYNPVLFLTVAFMAINMCFFTFSLQTVVLRQAWDEVFKLILLVFTVTVQNYIYCSYSERLTEETSLVAEATYNCRWVERCAKFKVMLQIILLRAQKPFYYTGYGVFFINLMQLSAMFKTAGSYFMMLQSLT